MNDFEIGYNYVKKHCTSLARLGTQNLWELGLLFLQNEGATSELSKGMGFYYLELGQKMICHSVDCTMPRHAASAKKSEDT